MEMLERIWHTTLDFIFGKSDVEERIRSLTPESFALLLKPQITPSGTVSLFRYQDPLIRELIWAVKYRRNTHAASLFAYAIETYLDKIGIPDSILVPIPLSPERLRSRGFNQIELVLQHSQKLPMLHCLRRTRNTKPQTSLPRTLRLKNMAGAFEVVRSSALKGKEVVIIDDVVTTGTTLTEAAETLKRAGAKKVHRLALAH